MDAFPPLGLSPTEPSQSAAADVRVRILPPHVVNRIAAGEVVERPASVVKELVENALDAGARRIEVAAADGGRTLRVADDGCGMSPEDARLAFYNHATSKIRDVADLDCIETLGFRGEALASIGAIARVTCLTRQAHAATGTRVVLSETGEPQLGDAGCAPGTIFEVADLFYNTPARLKFLKRPQTELGHIQETLELLALSHTGVRFSLSLNGREVLKTPGSGDLKATIGEIFRMKGETERLLPVAFSDPEAGLELTGFVGPPDFLKNARHWMMSFVNGRSVRCPVLGKAIEAGFESLVPQGRYPFAVLFLTLPTDAVDVNVHPTKREVRYARANTVFSFVRQGVLSALEAAGHCLYSAVPGPFPNKPPLEMQSASPSPLALPGQPLHRAVGFASSSLSPSTSSPLPVSSSQQALDFYRSQDAPGPAGADRQDAPERPIQTPSAPRVIGQLMNTYILLETPQGLMVVDQHIASERAFFEALTRNLQAETPMVQPLMASRPVGVTPAQAALLDEQRDALARLGFAFRLADNGQHVTLTAVPLVYTHRQDPVALFEAALARLESTGETRLDCDALIATLACHSAVRAGDVLSLPVMGRVVEDWLACRLPWTCPHGRPIAHTIRTEELQRFFDRPSMSVNA